MGIFLVTVSIVVKRIAAGVATRKYTILIVMIKKLNCLTVRGLMIRVCRIRIVSKQMFGAIMAEKMF